MKKIEIKNINFKYRNKIIFKDLDLDIIKNKMTTIVGPNNSGKSTLGTILSKQLDCLFLKDEVVNRYNIDTAKEYIIYYLKNLNFTNDQIEIKINYIKKELNLKNLDCQFDPLSIGQKQIINMACLIVSEKPIIILDNAMSFICELKKEKIFKLLKNLKETTIINITNNIEELIYTDYVIIINDGKIVINEELKNILKKEKVLKENNLDLPFMASLSLKLKYYNLLEEPVLNIDKMVDVLWK